MKQRITSIILALLMILPALRISAADDDYTYVDYGFGSVMIGSYTGNSSLVEVPSEYNGRKVAGICDSAFMYNTGIRELVLPEGIEIIYGSAFTGCTNLDMVSLPYSLKEICAGAFSECVSLSEITIPSSVEKIGSGVFDDCASGFKVKCYKDSPAETWCKDNSVSYEIVGGNCTHGSLYLKSINETGCISEGRSALICEDCGYADVEYMPETGHRFGDFKRGEDGIVRRSCEKCGAVLTGYSDCQFAEMTFDDVKVGAWYDTAVRFMFNNSLMQGTSSTSFEPDTTLNRAMLVTMLYRISCEDIGKFTAEGLTDVTPGSWYETYIAWGVGRGIISGYGEGRVGPLDPVTREQLVVILKSFTRNVLGIPVRNIGMDLTVFADHEDISDWARDAVDWAYGKELISGMDNNMIVPKGSATRAQVAQIIYKYIGNCLSGIKYDRVVYIQNSGAGNYINKDTAPNIYAIAENNTASAINDPADNFYSLWCKNIHGVSPEAMFATKHITSYKKPDADCAYPSILRLAAKYCGDGSATVFCDDLNTLGSLVEDGCGINTFSTSDDVTMGNQIVEYLNENVEKTRLLCVECTNCIYAGEYFEGGFGGKQYLQQIALTDGIVKNIYNEYKNAGLAERTLFIVSSDNDGMKNEDNVFLGWSTYKAVPTADTDPYALILNELGIPAHVQ
ncbi:MAG: S-layer homology domain-containing protein [Clostridia bacterium]|nr:S-layer homology domain-containing protein [Clostridia bacterium]